ncbi:MULTISPECIES: UDP-N-acetyl-D-mannosamine dehydrogenase [unclassified Mesorhizobium]|uniref:UDP-N-acetyl-D-mannosamine dehydrogenase n=1 Tax=unclassified Mesorhizobium TaxID=325217 RepID=UPI0003CE0D5A|nr:MULTISPECIES: UDP-N-acetyl-D-mannosamine dehydrogenase [unclassified Mesorhizobium]ESW77769.1 UDP-N-acetyl-D-mannosamine dehydrogenase [Mesorhizobium sp. LSJC285A00]ESX10542.1 UDP-N-acetyl-D-mannosamine dehydrogenase [Mesorhizobium sp. LSJC265A00]
MAEIKTVSVIGMGYIGLPTCAIFASRGLEVIGVDINEAVVAKVNRGEIHIIEPDLDGLIQKVVANGKLKAFSTPQPADAYIIAVPTPITPDRKPDVSYVLAAARSIAPVLKRDDLVVLESTSPVGTTRVMTALLAELRPDLKFPVAHGEEADVLVAYSPERVLPGKVLTELINNDRSIGGLSRKSSERTAALYSSFVAGDLFITQAESAELVKLTENAFRDVNIAFANELAAVCQDLSLNVWEVIDLANRHPRVNILQPSPGVGGHCIAIDPYFIIDAAPNNTRLISSARRINSERPLSVVRDIEALLDPTRNQTIACLGLSFKPNIDDMRESPAVEVVKLLSKIPNIKIVAAEPNARQLPHELEGSGIMFTDALSAIDQSDIVVLLVDHRQFNLIDPEALKDKKLVDTRGLWTWRKARKPDARIEGKKSEMERSQSLARTGEAA